MLIENDQNGEAGLVCGAEPFWSYQSVQAALVEAVVLTWRSESSGRWPFASDAPWQLMTRAARAQAGEVKGMDLQRLLLEDDERETRQWQGRERKRALTAEEVDWRDAVLAWLPIVPDRDRRIVVLAVRQLAAGRSQVDWLAVKRRIGVDIGRRGVGMRYSRAISAIAKALNAGQIAGSMAADAACAG